MKLLRDQRGVAYTETLLALPVVLFAFFGVYMFAYLSSASMVMQRAASAASRAASVFLADKADNYEAGGADPTEARMKAAHEAARRVLTASSALSKSSLTTSIDGNRGNFSPLRVRVQSQFDCKVFLVSSLCGLDGVVDLTAESVMPFQGL